MEIQARPYSRFNSSVISDLLDFLTAYPDRSFLSNQIQTALLVREIDIPAGQLRQILRSLYLIGMVERTETGHSYRYRIVLNR